MIRVLIKEPDKEIQETLIENDYKVIQKLIGNLIEHCFSNVIVPGVVMLIHEEGKLIDLPFNFKVKDYCETIVGTAVFVRHEHQIYKSLTDEDVVAVKNWLNEQNKISVNDFTKWLDSFIQEKNFNLKKFVTITIECKECNRIYQMQYQNIIDHLKNIDDFMFQVRLRIELLRLELIHKNKKEMNQAIAKFLKKYIHFVLLESIEDK